MKFLGNVFLQSENNGVIAVSTEEAFANYLLREKLIRFYEKEIGRRSLSSEDNEVLLANVNMGIHHISDTPIFTFARKDLAEQPWYTGDLELFDSLKKYVEANGGKFKRPEGGLYVPFSGGGHFVYEPKEYFLRLQRQELRFVATETQFVAAFGISREELRKSATNQRPGFGSLRA